MPDEPWRAPMSELQERTSLVRVRFWAQKGLLSSALWIAVEKAQSSPIRSRTEVLKQCPSPSLVRWSPLGGSAFAVPGYGVVAALDLRLVSTIGRPSTCLGLEGVRRAGERCLRAFAATRIVSKSVPNLASATCRFVDDLLSIRTRTHCGNGEYLANMRVLHSALSTARAPCPVPVGDCDSPPCAKVLTLRPEKPSFCYRNGASADENFTHGFALQLRLHCDSAWPLHLHTLLEDHRLSAGRQSVANEVSDGAA